MSVSDSEKEVNPAQLQWGAANAGHLPAASPFQDVLNILVRTGPIGWVELDATYLHHGNRRENTEQGNH